MERIWIAGCPGSGKTTLGRQLADLLDVRFIELDAIYHQKNWQPTPVPVFRARVSDALAPGRWVVDGNYRPVEDIIQTAMDTVIWLDLARWRVVTRVTRRSLWRVVTRKKLWNGNKETIRKLVSADPERNIIVWAWQHHPKYRARYAARMTDGTWASIHVHRLRSPAEIRKFRRRLSES